MEENGDSVLALKCGQGHGDDAQQLLHASAKPEVATGATGTRWKITNGEVSPAGTVHGNYRITTSLKSQITPKFVWQLKNLQKKSCSKSKVLQIFF